MASRYTDVDLMILKRWDETKALREAFDQLIDRMQAVVETTLQKVSIEASQRGLESGFDPKQPSIWFWKNEWATRKGDPGVYFFVSGFVPADYGKAIGDYPSASVRTEDLSKLRMRVSGEDFGRTLLSQVPPDLLSTWSHGEVELGECPLVRESHDVSESDRVRFVAEPDTLSKFILDRVDELMELVPAIDQTLQKMTRR